MLRHLMSSAFEPLESVSMRALTKKTLFLVSPATAKWVSEIQALSKTVAAIGNDLMVSFQPHFIAKIERADAPVSRSFRVLLLREFAGDLEEASLLCPVSGFLPSHSVFSVSSTGLPGAFLSLASFFLVRSLSSALYSEVVLPFSLLEVPFPFLFFHSYFWPLFV